MKKIISILMVAAIILTGFAAFGTLAGATTYVVYGDWLLAVNSNDTYLVGGYTGTDTVLSMPDTANDKAVIGVAADFSENCDSQITAVTLPDSYTVIGAYAFAGCAELESINFPPSLTALGTMAFNGCSALGSADLSGATGLLKIPYSCFSGCTQLGTVSLPDGITSLGEYCFNSCSSLGQFVVSSDVKSIGDNAFNGCVSLSSVVLPGGLETIGENAFYNDSELTSIYVPISVSSIGSNAFSPMAIEGGTLTIDCYADTYAANYAYENYLNYTGDTLVKGDADNNGVTNIRDVTYIQLYRAGLYEIGTDAKTVDRVDVTGDHQVTIRDATQIQLFRAGLIDSL